MCSPSSARLQVLVISARAPARRNCERFMPRRSATASIAAISFGGIEMQKTLHVITPRTPGSAGSFGCRRGAFVSVRFSRIVRGLITDIASFTPTLRTTSRKRRRHPTASPPSNPFPVLRSRQRSQGPPAGIRTPRRSVPWRVSPTRHRMRPWCLSRRASWRVLLASLLCDPRWFPMRRTPARVVSRMLSRRGCSYRRSCSRSHRR